MSDLSVQNIIDTLGEHIALLDEQGKILAVNTAWLDFAAKNGGLPEKLSVGTNYVAACSADALDDSARLAVEGIQSVLSGAQPCFSLDYACPSPDAERWFTMEVRPAAHSPLRVLVSHRQREHLASAKHFKALFDDHSAIKLVMDPATGEILNANKAAAEFYGWSIDELKRMHIHQINTLSPAEVKKAMAQVTDSQCRKFEFRHRRADGSIRDVEVYGNTIKDGGRRVMYSIIHDITGRKWMEAEKERLETQNRLLQKAEGLRRMAGAVAHHFNNHLQSVILALELAQQSHPEDPDIRQCIGGAMRSAREASNVSSLMLTYLGQTFAQLQTLDLTQFCQTRLPLLQSLLPDRVTLLTDLPPGAPKITANEHQLEQVLINLVSNAAEAIDSGAQGTIRLALVECPSETIPAARCLPPDWTPQTSSYLRLEVTDTGCGIPAQDQEKIFDPFFSTKFPGRGLGLAVVLGIVREHHGAITLDSTPALGTRFHLYFPAAP